jgi:hypothetical protein
MPYPAVCGDGFCGMKYKKGKAGHLYFREQMSDVGRQKIQIYS